MARGGRRPGAGRKPSGEVAMLAIGSPFYGLPQVAEELNRRGFRTRTGGKWSPVSVFQMLPRLIEIGPRLFSTEEWHQRRERIFRAM